MFNKLKSRIFRPKNYRDTVLESDMTIVQQITSAGERLRQTLQINKRFPLQRLYVMTTDVKVAHAIEHTQSILERSLEVKSVWCYEPFETNKIKFVELFAAWFDPQKRPIRQEFEGGVLFYEQNRNDFLLREGWMNEISRKYIIIRKNMGLGETTIVDKVWFDITDPDVLKYVKPEVLLPFQEIFGVQNVVYKEHRPKKFHETTLGKGKLLLDIEYRFKDLIKKCLVCQDELVHPSCVLCGIGHCPNCETIYYE